MFVFVWIGDFMLCDFFFQVHISHH